MSRAFHNPLARKNASVLDSARMIKLWARMLLALPDEAVVTVGELACHIPGCPPRETVILVMRGDQTLQMSIHKAMADVTQEDVAAALPTEGAA